MLVEGRACVCVRERAALSQRRARVPLPPPRCSEGPNGWHRTRRRGSEMRKGFPMLRFFWLSSRTFCSRYRSSNTRIAVRIDVFRRVCLRDRSRLRSCALGRRTAHESSRFASNIACHGAGRVHPLPTKASMRVGWEQMPMRSSCSTTPGRRQEVHCVLAPSMYRL